MKKPITLNKRLKSFIIGEIIGGMTLLKLSKKDNVPEMRYIHKAFSADQDFKEEYEEARIIRADTRSDRIDGIVEEMLDGTIPSDLAVVAINAEKWQASKEAPKRYGDRLHQNIAGATDSKPVIIQFYPEDMNL